MAIKVVVKPYFSTVSSPKQGGFNSFTHIKNASETISLKEIGINYLICNFWTKC
ncbi:hypothetical protein Bca4012_100107 [Brassica carinata]